MAHSSNIQINQDLMNFINKSKQDESVRAFKIVIKDEQLALDCIVDASGSLNDDFTQSVADVFVDKQPCFVLLRLDNKSHDGLYQWSFISWSPDDSPVRQKMLYASSKSILKLNLKSNAIAHEAFATSRDELESAIENRDKVPTSTEPDENLLTSHEQDLRTVKREEAQASCLPKLNFNLPGLEFPIAEDAVEALLKFRRTDLSYVQLSIDLSREMIQLESSKVNFKIADLSSCAPSKSARYLLVKFPHTYEKKFYESILFIYWAPASNCPVKERMLYSTCKMPLLNTLQDEKKFDITISKKLEVDDPSELTTESLIEELHPKEVSNGLKFAKPQGPLNKRGGKRLIKSPTES